jgi:hypothetical protein
VPDHPRGLHQGLAVGAGHRHLAEQLRSEAALLLGGGPATAGGVRGDLTPRVGPEVAAAGRGERADLEHALLRDEQYRHHRTALLVDLETQVELLRGLEQQAAQVDVGRVRVDLTDVERTVERLAGGPVVRRLGLARRLEAVRRHVLARVVLGLPATQPHANPPVDP